MRIGIDCRLWSESGVGRYIRNLVKEIDILEARKRTNTYVLFKLPKDIGGHEFVSQSFEEVVADIRWHSLREQIELPKIIAAQLLDCMHFPYFSIPLSYKDPFVVTVHDLIIYHHSTGRASTLPGPIYNLKHKAYKKVLAHGIKNSQKIITPSKFVEKDILNHFDIESEKITVTYEGIDDQISKKDVQSLNDTYAYLEDIPYFLYVGNAYPHKNVEMLIKAFQTLKANPETAPVHLVLVGKKDYFYNRIESSISPNDSILFLHDVSDQELASLYKQAKALVSVSYAEGFGLPILEAMSQKCLVVCSEIPVFKEIAENWVVYCNPRNIDSICNALKKILTMSAPDKMRMLNGAKKHSAQFSWQKMAKETISVYNTFLPQNNF